MILKDSPPWLRTVLILLLVLLVVYAFSQMLPGLTPFLAAFASDCGSNTLFWITVVFLIGKFGDIYVLSPKIVGQSLGLHSIVVILVLLLGGEYFGFAGLLLAVPLTAAASVFWDDITAAYKRSRFYGASETPSFDNLRAEQMRAPTPPRYRLEGDKTCIDIKLRNADQLFDGRDPAPFRERDLDEDAVEYILGAVQEIPPKAQIKMVFWIAGEPSLQIPVETFAEAVRAHFKYEVEKLRRRTREHVRQGQLTLMAALTVLAVFLTLAELTLWLPEGTLRQILREGLVIIGWVAMWRPLEVLLYDWWPMVRQRRLCARVVEAEITVEHGEGAAGQATAPA